MKTLPPRAIQELEEFLTTSDMAAGKTSSWEACVYAAFYGGNTEANSNKWHMAQAHGGEALGRTRSARKAYESLSPSHRDALALVFHDSPHLVPADARAASSWTVPGSGVAVDLSLLMCRLLLVTLGAQAPDPQRLEKWANNTKRRFRDARNVAIDVLKDAMHAYCEAYAAEREHEPKRRRRFIDGVGR